MGGGGGGGVQMTTLWQQSPYSEAAKKKKEKEKKTGCKIYSSRTFTLTHSVCLHMYVHRFSYFVMILYKPLI